MKHKNLIGSLITVVSLNAFAAGPLDESIRQQTKTNQAGHTSQVKISSLASETRSLIDDYRLTLRKIENTKTYNKQLALMIESQKQELDGMKKKVDRLKDTHRDIVPLMIRMVTMLEKFIKADIPFLAEERKTRLTNLKAQMKQAKYSTSEKYRRILEAYQVEAEYGRTMETYQDTLVDEKGKKKTVDYLRMGRLSWLYQSLDGKESGIWSPAEGTWHKLSGEFKKPLRQGILMAKKQKAPNLLHLPIFVPETML